MNQRGFTHMLVVLGFVLIASLVAGAYYLGKSSNKSVPASLEQVSSNPASPTISTISTPPDKSNWTVYRVKALNLEFRLPPNLATKYGKLIESESNGKRGSELKVSFANDSKSLIMTAQSPEYTPGPPAPVAMSEQEARDLAIGGPSISVPSVFQGFKYENELYYGIQSFGLVRELPKEQVTQYHTNGRDILKIKALYGDYGMVTHRIFPETPPKIWGIISGTGNQVYPGLTVQGILDNELTEPVFEQILSTFGLTQ